MAYQEPPPKPEWLPDGVYALLADEFYRLEVRAEKSRTDGFSHSKSGTHVPVHRIRRDGADDFHATLRRIAFAESMEGYWQGPARYCFEGDRGDPAHIFRLADVAEVVRSRGEWRSLFQGMLTETARVQLELGPTEAAQHLNEVSRLALQLRQAICDPTLSGALDRGTGELVDLGSYWGGRATWTPSPPGVDLAEALFGLHLYARHLSREMPPRLNQEKTFGDERLRPMLRFLVQWHESHPALSDSRRADVDRAAERVASAVLEMRIPARAAHQARPRS